MILSDDGVVRGASVRLSDKGNIVKLSVRCLYPLEVGSYGEALTMPPVDKVSVRSKSSLGGGYNYNGEDNIPNHCKLGNSSKPIKRNEANALPSLPSLQPNSGSKRRRAAVIASDLK